MYFHTTISIFDDILWIIAHMSNVCNNSVHSISSYGDNILEHDSTLYIGHHE